MNMWIIASILVCVLLIGGIVTVNALASDKPNESVKCTSCNNKCTADKNCGLQSCGAVNGKSCNCGK